MTDRGPTLYASRFTPRARTRSARSERSDGKRVVARLGALLLGRGLVLATAESCTGGLVGDMVTDLPGSSEFYAGGVVAYANEVKMNLLGVSEETLARYGAVSSRAVREMAAGVCALTGADVGLAVSGIAGPTGGSKKKPVGLVYFGVAAGEKYGPWFRRRFSGTRREIKEHAAAAALELCCRVLRGGR